MCVNSIREPYLQSLTLIERLHRRLEELCAGELRTRGYYLGTNVSYNLKKLVQIGLIEHHRSRIDRRSVRIKLTAKGQEVYEIVEALCQKHARTVGAVADINAGELDVLNKLLHRLERFWTDQIVYRM
jgi:DNA-binding MarR family transcriptional regulator